MKRPLIFGFICATLAVVSATLIRFNLPDAPRDYVHIVFAASSIGAVLSFTIAAVEGAFRRIT